MKGPAGDHADRPVRHQEDALGRQEKGGPYLSELTGKRSRAATSTDSARKLALEKLG